MREQTYPGSYESHLRRRVKELEEENERLLRVAKRARAYLWQADDGKGLDEMLRQAIHPHSE